MLHRVCSKSETFFSPCGSIYRVITWPLAATAFTVLLVLHLADRRAQDPLERTNMAYYNMFSLSRSFTRFMKNCSVESALFCFRMLTNYLFFISLFQPRSRERPRPTSWWLQSAKSALRRTCWTNWRICPTHVRLPRTIWSSRPSIRSRSTFLCRHCWILARRVFPTHSQRSPSSTWCSRSV